MLRTGQRLLLGARQSALPRGSPSWLPMGVFERPGRKREGRRVRHLHDWDAPPSAAGRKRTLVRRPLGAELMGVMESAMITSSLTGGTTDDRC